MNRKVSFPQPCKFRQNTVEDALHMVGQWALMFCLDSSAFLTFIVFHKFCECYTEEATLGSCFCLFLLSAITGQAEEHLSCQWVSRERQQSQKSLSETSLAASSAVFLSFLPYICRPRPPSFLSPLFPRSKARLARPRSSASWRINRSSTDVCTAGCAKDPFLRQVAVGTLELCGNIYLVHLTLSFAFVPGCTIIRAASSAGGSLDKPWLSWFIWGASRTTRRPDDRTTRNESEGEREPENVCYDVSVSGYTPQGEWRAADVARWGPWGRPMPGEGGREGSAGDSDDGVSRGWVVVDHSID